MSKFSNNDLSIIKGIVGEVVEEKITPLQKSIASLEKKVNALSKDNAPSKQNKATEKKSTTTKSTEAPVKKGKLQTLAEEFGMSLDRYVKGKVTTYILTQTKFIKDRYYLEVAMDNKGELIKGSKYKQYTFKTDEKGIEKVLKAMDKSRKDYRNNLA